MHVERGKESCVSGTGLTGYDYRLVFFLSEREKILQAPELISGPKKYACVTS